MNTDQFKPLLDSALQIGGTLIGIVLFFFMMSFISRMMNRFSRVKPKSYVSLLPDAEGTKKLLPRSAPVILQMAIAGVIGKEELNLEQIETQLVESQMGELKGRIKGILLRINSPGGSAIDSDSIYRRLKAYKEKYKIPIYAYAEGLLASGSLLIGCAADRIYASPSSIVGSVGVLWMMPFFNVHKVLQKWEIDVRTFSEGKRKDYLSPFRPWEEGEDADLRNLLAFAYNRFVDIVVKERKMDKAKLIEELGAQIFPAPESAALGYIDEGNSDYGIALRELVQAAGIDKEESYQVVELLERKHWFKELFARSPLINGKIKHELHIGPYSSTSSQGHVAYLLQY